MAHQSYDAGIPARDEHQGLGNHVAGRVIEAVSEAVDEEIECMASVVAACVGTLVGSGIESLEEFHDDPDAAQAFVYAVVGEIQFYLENCASPLNITGFITVYDKNDDE